MLPPVFLLICSFGFLLLLFLHVFAFLCICVSICVSRGQLVGVCSLVCRNWRLTQESWLLLTTGPADQAQAFRLSRKFLAASLFGFWDRITVYNPSWSWVHSDSSWTFISSYIRLCGARMIGVSHHTQSFVLVWVFICFWFCHCLSEHRSQTINCSLVLQSINLFICSSRI